MTATDSDTPSAEQQSPPEQSIHHLSAFQRDLLVALSTIENNGEMPYGLNIKRRLEDLYDGDVNHGRLYPNLDTLVAGGYIEKGQIDKRTNSYTITESGIKVLENRKDEIKNTL